MTIKSLKEKTVDPRQNKQFDNRGLLMAMAVSLVVLFAWEYFRAPMLKEEALAQQELVASM